METENKTERLDAALVGRGILTGRDSAKAQIRRGFVRVNGVVVTKPAFPVKEKDILTCDDNEASRFVGRGGLKLQKALDSGLVTPKNKICLDVGASTGGFTDCMLQNGAKTVYAVDVGHDQLHPKLMNNPRVVNLEGIDIRKYDEIAHFLAKSSVQFCSVDVSFISVEKIGSALLPWLAEDAQVVVLIKPQFEAGKQYVGKNGIVKDAKVHCTVLEKVLNSMMDLGFCLLSLTYSPITGGEGNIEYLSIFNRNSDFSCKPDINGVVTQAHQMLPK